MAQSDFNRAAALLERLGVAARADVVSLYAARAARGFGDGFAAIILPAYLLEIGFGPFQIGLVATAALLGRHHLGHRVPGAALRLAHAAARLCGLDGGDRDRDPELPASRLHRGDCLYRHDEPHDRGHRRARAARTSCARTPGIGPGSHARFRAL